MKNLTIVLCTCALTFVLAGCGSSQNPTDDPGADAVADIAYDTSDAMDDTGVNDLQGRDVDVLGTDIPGTDIPVDPDVTTDIEQLDLVDDSGDTTTDIVDIITPPVTPWHMMPVTIEDDVVNGNNVMTPVDGLTFGYNAQDREFVTYFSHDVDNAEIAELWYLDETTGVHSKKVLGGNPIAALTNFCFDEDWCQFIGYDSANDKYVVLGPRSPAVMSVDDQFAASQTQITGTQPPNGGISYSHVFAWDIDRLLVYGFVTGSGFGKTLYGFNLTTGEWSQINTELPEILGNCLAWNSGSELLYSFGGSTTNDGGETSSPYGKYSVTAVTGNSTESNDLPMELASREGMSCAADPANGLIYVFGGAVINDNWDERQNSYHNDLWIMDTSDGTWTKIIDDGPTGTFEQYGEDWMFVGDATLPNFGRNIGRMEFDGSETGPRLILMGDVPGTATQIYTLDIADL